MDVRRLKYFCTVVEQGQINRAAKVLHISQSPLCQRLKELEDEVGVTLIARGRSQWQVTPAGELLYEEGKRILDGLDDLKRRLSLADETAVSGDLHLGVSPMCGTRMLSAVAALKNAHPKLRIRVSVLESTPLEEAVSEGSVDVGLAVLPLFGTKCDVVPLPAASFVVVEKRDAGIVPKDRLTAKDLALMPLMTPRRRGGGGLTEQLIEGLKSRGIRLEVVLESENVQMLLHLAHLGVHAAALVPESEVPLNALNDLRIVPVDGAKLEMTPALIVKHGRYRSAAIREAVRLLCDEAGVAAPF